jgi:hypothetical protein
MPTLHDTLQTMRSSLLRQDNAAEELVADSAFEPTHRLQLYRNNLVISLTEALAAIYPVVQRLVGEDFFKVACREFIPMHPPRQAPLHQFGNVFPEFIRAFKPASSLPYLADVAALEWAWHEAYHAADAGEFDTTALQQVSQTQYSDLRFALHPALRLVRSTYPLHRIWQVNQETFNGDQSVDLDEGSVCILVTRPHLEVIVQAIPEAEWIFLSLLKKGCTIDEAVKAAMQVDARFDLATVLESRVADHTIVSTSILK